MWFLDSDTGSILGFETLFPPNEYDEYQNIYIFLCTLNDVDLESRRIIEQKLHGT